VLQSGLGEDHSLIIKWDGRECDEEKIHLKDILMFTNCLSCGGESIHY